MRFKEVKKLITEQQTAEQLFEVNMSPSNLAKLATQIDARAGMEFEMIVPDTESVDDGNMEPDYEQDESVRDIDDACNFFDDGDYNSRSDIRNLRSNMEEDYSTWIYEKTDEDWHNGNGFEFFLEYMDSNNEFDRDSGLDDARDYVAENNPTLEVGTDEYEEAVSERLRELEAEFYQQEWERKGRNYDFAREEFDDEKRDDYEQSDWLNDAGIGSMTDVAREYDVQWPHWTHVSHGGRSVEDVADNFSRAIGRPVNSSTSYHGARREEGHYVVEPDGSLEGEDAGDTGLEFVSPPLPLPELLSDLKKVQKWAKSEGAYTGADFGTGLHINVSVPGLGAGQENLDYVKLALLLGDEYVLKEFERTSNTYCKSGLEIVKRNIKDRPEDAKQLLDQMKSGLEQMASRAIHGAITNKFTSINTKDGYVEFRSPGGDWLNDKFDKIEPTLLRFVVALDAAVKPDLYRQEYLKKLYKALEPAGNKNTIEYFAKYVAGEIPQAALKSFVRQAQLERNIKAGKTTGKMWWNVKYAGQQIEVVADNKGDAKVAAVKEWGLTPAQAELIRAANITPLRPYEEKPEQAQQDSGIYRITTTGGGLIAGDNYGSDEAALERAALWATRRGVDVIVRNEQGQEIGRADSSGDITVTAQQPTQPAPQAQQSSTGDWGLWLGHANRFARWPSTENMRRFETQQAAEDYLENLRQTTVGLRSDIEVRAIPPGYSQPGDTAQIEPQGVDTSVNYEIYNRESGNAIRRIQARNDDEAREALENHRALMPTSAQNRVGVRRAGTGQGAQAAAATQQPNWEITRDGTNVVVYRFHADNQDDAIAKANDYIRIVGGDIDSYTVQAIEQPASDAAQGGAIGGTEWDVVNLTTGDTIGRVTAANQLSAFAAAEPVITQFNNATGNDEDDDYEVRPVTQPAQAPRTLTTPGQGQQVFTGEWKVVDSNGQELYRFSGVGNSQADANRVAAQWAQRNMVSDEVNVVPVMGQA